MSKKLDFYTTKISDTYKEVLQFLTSDKNIKHLKFYPDNDKKMGFQIESLDGWGLRQPKYQGLYMIFFKDCLAYIGKGYIDIRIGRFVKAALNNNLPNEEHKAGTWFYNNIEFKDFDKFKISYCKLTNVSKEYEESVLLTLEDVLIDELGPALNTQSVTPSYNRIKNEQLILSYRNKKVA
jgi:hypothetical protein